MSSPAPGATATGHHSRPTRPHATRRRSRTCGPGRRAWPWALAAALAAVGCAARPPSPSDTTATPASTVAAPAHAANDKPSRPPAARPAVDAAYRRFWDIAQTLDQHPEDQWRALLSQVAAEPVLTRILDGLQSRTRAGYRQFGVVVPRAVVVDLSGDRASVLDCQDASRSGEIDTATGLVATVGRPRTPVSASLVRGGDGRWRVSEARYLDGDC